MRLQALDKFFAEVPRDWHYGVEVRNANFLHEEYFDVLRRHDVAHLYNQWTLMPGVDEQMGLHPPQDNPFIAARFLLTPPRSRDWAQREFEPYNQMKELDPVARQALTALIEAASPSRPAYVYVSNLLEGNALHTISDVVRVVG